MEEQESKYFNDTIMKQEKFFSFYKKLPMILFISIIIIFFIWGIVDPAIFNNGYMGEGTYGIMMLPSALSCFVIWQIIGVVIAYLTFLIAKISLSYKILHIEYLKSITDIAHRISEKHYK